MSRHASRRTILRTATVAAAASLTGCLWGNEETHGTNLFLENMKGQDQVVQLIVSPGEEIDGERVVDNWYEAPEGVALEFENVLESGQTYTVGLQAADEPPDEHIASTVDPCEGEPDADATRDVSVRVRDEGHGVIPWGCDEEYTERNLDYRPADQHSVEPPGDAGTWTSPTPSSIRRGPGGPA